MQCLQNKECGLSNSLRMEGDLGKLIGAKGFEKLPEVQ